MMEISDIVKEMAETLRLMPELAGVPVIEEEKGNVEKTLALKVSQSKSCVMVGWNGFTPVIQGETAPNKDLFGEVALVATVFERPLTNRVSAGAPRLLEMAKAIAKELNGASAEGMDAPLYLKRISPVMELKSSGSDGSTVMCTVEFTNKTSL